jgi:Bacterial Ig-like domain (group 3)/MBG domain (YGX type)/Beta-propeller repeat
MRRATVISAAVLLLTPPLVGWLRAQTISAQTNSPQAAGIQNLRLADTYGRLPLSFEANEGQTDHRVRFLSRSAGQTLFLTSEEAVLAPRAGHPVRMKLAAAKAGVTVLGIDQLPGKSNYFLGNDPAEWHANVPTYAKVRYEQIYPGVDLLYYGNQRELEYDFVISPGADPAQIRLAIEGAEKIWIDADGNAVLHCPSGDIRLLRPRLYQEILGVKKEIKGGFILKGHELRFVIAQYDHHEPLVIDPVLVYSTYLGGSGVDLARGIVVDSAGSAYVAGYTGSTNFPLSATSEQGTFAGGTYDVFVAKLTPGGDALVYSTFIGGNNDDVANGLAVDASGNVYVTGTTSSTNFPTSAGAFQTTFAFGGDAFVTKLNATGNALVYSTYLGGSGVDTATSIAVDSFGSAYVTGQTQSVNFPTTPGVFQTSNHGGTDAFVTKLNPAGTALVYSTYLGGTGSDSGFGIAIDASGNAYIAGETASTDLPGVASTSVQSTNGGGNDAFVAELNTAGSALIYCTYLGGSGTDLALGIALDSTGNAYVTGYTSSTNFPVSAGAFQTTNGGGFDAFAAKLDPGGTALVYSTYLGGSGTDTAAAIAVDSSGNAYVAGGTASTNFPGVGASSLQPAYGGGSSDAFVAELNPAGSALVYSTYLGGSGQDVAASIALDSANNIYLGGYTASTNFPLGATPVQSTYGGGSFDAFVAKLSSTSPGAATTTILAASANPSVFGQSLTLTATVTSSASGTPTGTVTFLDGTTTIGSATLSNGQASLSVFSLTTGAHSIKAAYGGDATFAGSTSIALTETISQGGSSTTISASPNPGVVGQPVTLTAAVSAVPPATGTPTGTVTFLDGTTSLGTGTLSGGQATLTTSSLSAGAHAISATHVGDTNFLGSTSSAFTLAVQQTTSTTLAVSPNPATAGQPVSLSATVTPGGAGTPTGSVTFFDGTSTLGTATVTAGTATFITSSLAAGMHSLTAFYPGDSNFAPSSSSATTLSAQLPPAVITVNETITVTDMPSFPDILDAEQISVTDQVAIQVLNTTTTSIVAPGGVYGTPASATVAVSSSTATVSGNVTLSVDGGPATALPLTGGSATFTFGVLTAGNHLLAANFPAQGNFTGSSAQATLVINQATPTITWANPAPITYGTPLSGTQLNATASVLGTFAYTPAAGTVLSPGNNQTLSVTFHPTDSMDYTLSTANVTITVLNTGVGTNVTVTPLDTTTGTTPVIVNFSNVTQAGMTSLTTGSNGAPPPPGYRKGNPGIYFDISTTAAFAGMTTACINYTGIIFLNPSGPHFFHYENGAWVDHTVSIDTLNRIVCGTVTSFSPFALFDLLPVLTITANPASRQYGMADPGFTASYAGFANGDTPASLSGALSCASNDTASSPVGTYAINCSGLSSPNYNIAYAPGTLTITAAPLTITASNASRPYGANNPAFTGTVIGLLNADPVSANFGSSTTPGTVVGSYAIVPTVVGAADVVANYATTLVSGTLTVTPETTSLAISVAPTSIAVGQSATVTLTLTAPDMVIHIDPSVLAAITVSSPIVSDILTNNGVCTPAPSATPPGVASCTITITSIEPNGRTLTANFPGSANLTPSSTTADLIVTAALESQQTCIASDFRNVAVPGGSYLWFNSIFKVRDVPQQKITLTFFQSSVQFQYKDGNNVVSVSQPMPDARIVIDPTITSASTTFDSINNAWLTTVPFDTDDAVFLSGLPWLVPDGGIPGDIEPVTWCGTFASDTPSVEIGWRWAAAAYSSFGSDGSVLGVKPMDTDNQATNHDRAGTPENYKQFVIPGARGKGAKNYTGTYSGRAEIE